MLASGYSVTIYGSKNTVSRNSTSLLLDRPLRSYLLGPSHFLIDLYKGLLSIPPYPITK